MTVSASILSRRRKALSEAVGGEPILLVGHGKTPRNFLLNTLPYRQDSTFLYFLGALEPGSGRLTDEGRRMLALPTHPRLARLITSLADAGRLAEGVRLAALVEERDIFRFRGFDRESTSRGVTWRRGPVASSSSDLLRRLDLFREAESSNFSTELALAEDLDPGALRAVARLTRHLEQVARRRAARGPSTGQGSSHDDEEGLLRAVLLAYPDRVVRR